MCSAPCSIFFVELVEKYGDLDFPRSCERRLKAVKAHLPVHRLDPLFRLFAVVVKKITGKARIVKPTIQTQMGTARIAPYQPKSPTVAELVKRAEQERTLRQLMLGNQGRRGTSLP